MTPRLSDRVAERLVAMIAEQALQPGDRLPAERALSEAMGVGRSSLREAIGQLTANGRLATRRGGGTYVGPGQPRGQTGGVSGGGTVPGARGGPAGAAPGTRSDAPVWSEGAMMAPLGGLLGADPAYRYDVLEIRQSLEGAAARAAALRATPEDKAGIAQAFAAMRRGTAPGPRSKGQTGPEPAAGSSQAAAEAEADARFHLSIARASHNVVLFQVLRGMFDLLQATTTRNLEQLYLLPRIREPLEEQHRALMDAVVAGDAAAAEAASDRHLAFVQSSLRSLDEDAARRARARSMSPMPGPPLPEPDRPRPNPSRPNAPGPNGAGPDASSEAAPAAPAGAEDAARSRTRAET
ncbi:hypothetical protein ASG43_19265 [Aureimonas sp. Leaf454]|uniref:FCD domain-containing protein n=1 Tax=Aureimonas sp. Leaf454 TaxID=1736381 RepID=UPI000701CE8E|nr:FCD domain-containing protein [Aureimonas sp. Leaf454]KQT53122.1 hypothetical protein ASG43_19265 [Aureimonas sp. Leaf454]